MYLENCEKLCNQRILDAIIRKKLSAHALNVERTLIYDKSRSDVVILRKGFQISLKEIPKTAEERSMNLLKAKIYSSEIKFRTFLTITFDEDSLLENFGATKYLSLTDNVDDPEYYNGSSCILHNCSTSTCIRSFFNKLKHNLKKSKYPHLRKFANFEYVWRAENGKEKGRLHFHILMNIPANVSKHFNFRQIVRKDWGRGFHKVVEIVDRRMMCNYLTKYITKPSHIAWKDLEHRVDILKRSFIDGRRWGSSRGVKFKQQREKRRLVGYRDYKENEDFAYLEILAKESLYDLNLEKFIKKKSNVTVMDNDNDKKSGSNVTTPLS